MLEEMLAVVCTGSTGLFLISIIATIIQLIRKKSIKAPTIIMVVAILLLIISLIWISK